MSNVHDLQQRDLADGSKLAAAVSAVMSDVRRLEKADNNAFAKYRFTSVDDYKDHLRPLLAKNGLAVSMTQFNFERFKVEAKKSGDGDTLHCEYAFELWLEHVSGEAGSPEKSTVCLPYVGAQTSGQARSYAIKEWLKSKFLASSGDVAEDADHQTVILTKAQVKELGVWEKLETSLREIGQRGTREDLKGWNDEHSVLVESLPPDYIVMLRQEYKHAQIDVQAREKTAQAAENLPANIDEWLRNMEDDMASMTNLDDLNEMWLEYEQTSHILRDNGDTRAMDVFKKHEERLRK